ncbi:nuclear transport factor 2 family protein [Micromonospora sp. RTGN7]|uniref:nuclear transport factor 2 family protein n=1 Tax=Micromonospora sp. RTGN7 TaxID=3016526 RepID=UPI0029FF46CE|nr:nuclear transport factor 2 family protein [Micromonospora sp. RTGN7]
MTHPHLDTISRFFEAYSKRDMAALAEVTTEDLTWHFPGRNPMSGAKRGREEVMAFFDRMGGMGFRPEKLITGTNDSYVVETQWVRGDSDGQEVTMGWTVLWSFVDGKLASGRHFSADQYLADEFFTRRLATQRS